MEMIEIPIQRGNRPADLSYHACKKRQSPRTGLVHLYCNQPEVWGVDPAADTIPIYENGCFFLALLIQKKTETVLEARQLLLRLLAFQTVEGNFPIYLHDFPRCYDPHLALKMAPLFLRALRDFSQVLGLECKEKIENSLIRIFSYIEQRQLDRTLEPLWEFRYAICKSIFEKRGRCDNDLSIFSHLNQKQCSSKFDFNTFTTLDWWEYWITLQLFKTPSCNFYHPGIQKTLGSFIAFAYQDRFEPSFELIDWMCVQSFDVQNSMDRSSQIPLVALENIDILPLNTHIEGLAGWLFKIASLYALLAVEYAGPNAALPMLMQLLWKDISIHSLCLESRSSTVTSTLDNDCLSIQFDLSQDFELQRDALFEVSLFVDASPDIELFIEGKKGNCFSLGDTFSVKTPSFQVDLCFNLLEGEGDFCIHIFKGNRTQQKAKPGPLQYEAFDWKIGVRTLRRSAKCSLGLRIQIQN